MKGAELSVHGDLGAGITAGLSYTRLDAEDEVEGKPLLRRPDNRVSVDLGYAWDERLDVHARLLWVDERPDVDPDLFTDIVIDAYTRLDLSASFQALPWLAPFARVQNALDADYEEAAGFPAPGRTISGGLRVTWD
jgi:vitamin B12 transporter